MPKIGELITDVEFAKHSNMTVHTVRVYGSQGKIKRRKFKNIYKYVWGSDKAGLESEYICEYCGQSEKKCNRMLLVKFIEEFLVSLDDFVSCKC